MEYDINPAGVAGVLTQTRGALDDLWNTGLYIEDATNSSMIMSASPTITAKLQGFLEGRVTPDVAAAYKHGRVCLGAAQTATGIYLAGDVDMALEAQSAAAGAPDPTADMPGRGPR